MQTSPNSNDRSRCEMLLQLYFEGEITLDEAGELASYWDENRDFDEFALKNLDVDLSLFFFAALEKHPIRLSHGKNADVRDEIALQPVGSPFENDRSASWNEALNFDGLAHLAAESPAVPLSVTPTSARTVDPPSPQARDAEDSKALLPLTILLPLILLVFGLGVYSEFRPVPEARDSNDPFGPFSARVSELVDASFGDGAAPLKRGARLDGGPVSLLTGLMEIEYQNGVRVVLEGPATYHVGTPLEAACDCGRLSVHVPPEGQGFTVTTPMMTVRDLGTKFVLEVDADDTRLQVVEGEVEANWLAKDWLSFKAGRGVRRQTGKDVRNLNTDPDAFVSEAKVRQRKNEYVAARRPVWNEQEGRMASDPALFYRLTPQTASHPDKTAGSREDKTALEFRHAGGRVPLAPHRECRDLTLIASVRLASLKNNTNIIVTGNKLGSAAGEFLWQVNRLGEVHLQIDGGGGRILQFDTPPVFNVKNRETWHQLAVVADAAKKTVVHYRDGVVVVALPWDRPVPLRATELTVGNRGFRERSSTTRYFHGAIEDLWMFSRPFASGEIEDFYRNNY